MSQKTILIAEDKQVGREGPGVASEESAASLGACGLFRKPVETAPLLAEVKRFLGEGQG